MSIPCYNWCDVNTADVYFVHKKGKLNMKETMAERIKRLRKFYGLNQEQLGKIVGVSRPQIGKYETGDTQNMKRNVIQKMSNYFHVSPAYLMCMTDDPDDGKLELDDIVSSVINNTSIQVLVKMTKDLPKEDIEKIINIVRTIIS